MAKDSIVFISTIHRMSERIICAISELQKDFDVKVINTGQSSFHTKYEGHLRYKKYVTENFSKNSIFNSPGISKKGEARFSSDYIKNVVSLVDSIVGNNTAAVILDDSRATSFFSDVYDLSKRNGSLVFANAHGNMPVKNIPVHYGFSGKKFHDYIFVLGECEREHIERFGFDKHRALAAGIPDNDSLESLPRKNDIILVVTNFVLKEEIGQYTWDHCKNPKIPDTETLKKMKLLELQKKTGKKVVFKLKPRMGDPLQKEIDFLRSNIPDGLDYEIVHYVDCEKSLVSRASCVLSYGSTMTFKSIQLGIPTVVYREFGHVGGFIDYKGLIDIGDSYDFIFDDFFMEKERTRFLNKTLKGGCDFTATDIYISSLYKKLKRGDLLNELHK